MDALAILLDMVKKSGRFEGNFLGLLNVLVGRSISRTSDNVQISKGMTWRELATLLKKLRWDPETVRELGLDPDQLPPRDRQRYWYGAIMQAKVDRPEAISAGERFAELLQTLGYVVGPPPHAS